MEIDKFQPFVLDLYTQLGQVQRDIGSLTAGQHAMAEQLRQQEAQMRESESRIIHAMSQFEVRITARIDKVESDLSARIQATESGLSARIQSTESGLSARIQSTESNLSALRDRANRVLWAIAGGGVVLGLALGWKPILARAVDLLGS